MCAVFYFYHSFCLPCFLSSHPYLCLDDSTNVYGKRSYCSVDSPELTNSKRFCDPLQIPIGDGSSACFRTGRGDSIFVGGLEDVFYDFLHFRHPLCNASARQSATSSISNDHSDHSNENESGRGASDSLRNEPASGGEGTTHHEDQDDLFAGLNDDCSEEGDDTHQDEESTTPDDGDDPVETSDDDVLEKNFSHRFPVASVHHNVPDRSHQKCIISHDIDSISFDCTNLTEAMKRAYSPDMTFTLRSLLDNSSRTTGSRMNICTGPTELTPGFKIQNGDKEVDEISMDRFKNIRLFDLQIKNIDFTVSLFLIDQHTVPMNPFFNAELIGAVCAALNLAANSYNNYLDSRRAFAGFEDQASFVASSFPVRRLPPFDIKSKHAITSTFQNNYRTQLPATSVVHFVERFEQMLQKIADHDLSNLNPSSWDPALVDCFKNVKFGNHAYHGYHGNDDRLTVGNVSQAARYIIAHKLYHFQAAGVKNALPQEVYSEVEIGVDEGCEQNLLDMFHSSYTALNEKLQKHIFPNAVTSANGRHSDEGEPPPVIFSVDIGTNFASSNPAVYTMWSGTKASKFLKLLSAKREGRYMGADGGTPQGFNTELEFSDLNRTTSDDGPPAPAWKLAGPPPWEHVHSRDKCETELRKEVRKMFGGTSDSNECHDYTPLQLKAACTYFSNHHASGGPPQPPSQELGSSIGSQMQQLDVGEGDEVPAGDGDDANEETNFDGDQQEAEERGAEDPNSGEVNVFDEEAPAVPQETNEDGLPADPSLPDPDWLQDEYDFALESKCNVFPSFRSQGYIGDAHTSKIKLFVHFVDGHLELVLTRDDESNNTIVGGQMYDPVTHFEKGQKGMENQFKSLPMMMELAMTESISSEERRNAMVAVVLMIRKLDNIADRYHMKTEPVFAVSHVRFESFNVSSNIPRVVFPRVQLGLFVDSFLWSPTEMVSSFLRNEMLDHMLPLNNVFLHKILTEQEIVDLDPRDKTHLMYCAEVVADLIGIPFYPKPILRMCRTSPTDPNVWQVPIAQRKYNPRVHRDLGFRCNISAGFMQYPTRPRRIYRVPTVKQDRYAQWFLQYQKKMRNLPDFLAAKYEFETALREAGGLTEQLRTRRVADPDNYTEDQLNQDTLDANSVFYVPNRKNLARQSQPQNAQNFLIAACRALWTLYQKEWAWIIADKSRRHCQLKANVEPIPKDKVPRYKEEYNGLVSVYPYLKQCKVSGQRGTDSDGTITSIGKSTFLVFAVLLHLQHPREFESRSTSIENQSRMNQS